ncbi:hypothetical protein [Agreia sp. Leaf283]|uniref:hypothetical protein n=1 Tax=Agreia sp. Leaf283 TaxID=1736321 RepID=UPI0006F20571|nr:hypothetical protein [Agreia sp. Leaf283]KQP57189.1 hypothetical protein ASF51_04780 [Agreia sp. Leaf283]
MSTAESPLARTRLAPQKTMVIEQGDPVVDGQETRLWYDATNPGDVGGIVVELARERRLRR